MLLGATGTKFTASGGEPFPGRDCVDGAHVPDHARWLRDHVRSARAETLLGIVRTLDKQMNNTSLILVFEVGGARLLFPGDAQIENWQYALANPKYRKLLADTTFYKVGHHGSRNATPKAGLWEHFAKRSAQKDDADRMWSIVSTMAGKHGTTEATRVPRKTLVEALEGQHQLPYDAGLRARRARLARLRHRPEDRPRDGGRKAQGVGDEAEVIDVARIRGRRSVRLAPGRTVYVAELLAKTMYRNVGPRNEQRHPLEAMLR